MRVNALRFLDQTTGIAATSDGKIYRTADGANSWTVVNDTQRQVRSFLFFDAKNGVAVGDGSLFLATDDAGVDLDAEGADDQRRRRTCRRSRARPPKLCVMATGTNQLVRTTDGGADGHARRTRAGHGDDRRLRARPPASRRSAPAARPPRPTTRGRPSRPSAAG